MARTALVERTTKESDVRVELDLDGTGQGSSDTGVPFFDHMVSQLGRHGGFDLTVVTKGDLHIDAHHTVEDTSLALGTALKQALGDKAGVRRFGDATVPLDECLVQAAVDLSGRPYLVHEEPEMVELIGSYDTTLTKHIWESFVATSRHRPARARAERPQRPPHRGDAVQGRGARPAQRVRARPEGDGSPLHQGRPVIWALYLLLLAGAFTGVGRLLRTRLSTRRAGRRVPLDGSHEELP